MRICKTFPFRLKIKNKLTIYQELGNWDIWKYKVYWIVK